MQKKWTKNLAIVGFVLGIIIGAMSDNFYGLHHIEDFAFLLGSSLPLVIIFSVVGLIIDYFLNSRPNINTHVKCPDCRELILKDARKCKHCGCNLIPQ
jgi:hypothetical protein